MQTVMTDDAVHTLTINKAVQIAAPVDVAWAALLEEVGPGSATEDGKPLHLRLEPWPGGRWFRDLGNNAGHLWGHVQVIKPPALLELCGPMPMSYPAINHVQYRLKAEAGGTLLTMLHRAMGLLPSEHREGMPRGWEIWIGRIKQTAEQRAMR